MRYNSELYKQYANACNSYLQVFCKKHDLDYNEAEDGWVANEVGTIVLIGDYFISFDDIILDIEENVPEEKFFQYYDWSLGDGNNWNYKTWLKGGQPEPIEYDIESKIKEFQQYIDRTLDDDCPFPF